MVILSPYRRKVVLLATSLWGMNSLTTLAPCITERNHLLTDTTHMVTVVTLDQDTEPSWHTPMGTEIG